MKIASRAVLIKSIYRLWCEGDSWEELFAAIQALPQSFTQPYYAVREWTDCSLGVPFLEV